MKIEYQKLGNLTNINTGRGSSITVLDRALQNKPSNRLEEVEDLKMDEKTINELKKIREWINEKYPGGCCENTLDESRLLEDVSDFFQYELLSFCGCGCPEASIRAVRDYLAAVNHHTKNNTDEGWEEARQMLKDKFGVEYVTDDPLLQYMAYHLDDRGLTDHGSSINGAWIEERGEKCLYVFDLLLKEEYGENESDPEMELMHEFETRIKDKLPTVIMFLDNDKVSSQCRTIFGDGAFFRGYSLDAKVYDIDINNNPNIAAKYHVGFTDTEDLTLTEAPLIMVCADEGPCITARFNGPSTYNSVIEFMVRYKKSLEDRR